LWGGALALLVTAAGTSHAAWNNVFQVCCSSCGGGCAPVVSNAAPDPCCNPCPPTCTTRYVQRCYYQPVTSYCQKTYYEPCTSYQTSYYYEPCCSYRYSCYYDPCSCSYQQVATPVTSFRLRSQCCPVTSYLQRCCMVPVTSYQQVSYWEPVTTCCQTPCNSCGSCPSCSSCGSSAAAPAPAAPSGPVAPVPNGGQPGVYGGSGSPPPAGTPGVDTFRDSGSAKPYDSYRQQPAVPGTMPPASNRQLAPQGQPSPAAPAAPPRVRMDRIVSLSNTGVEGQVVRSDRTPQAGVKVLFVNIDHRDQQQSAVSDRAGQFRANLPAGTWLVYVHDAAGRPVLHSTIEVRGETRHVTLVSR
jgi:hypothetical protein